MQLKLPSPFKKSRARTAIIIGYPNHGKTVFLAGMFWDSFFALSESFQSDTSPYAVRAVNARAGEVFFGNAIALSKFELPPSSPRTPPEPAILDFAGIPNGQKKRANLHVTFYDIPGELVSDEAWLARNAHFLPTTDDIIFIFDPTRSDFASRALQAADLCDRISRLIPGVDKRNYLVVLSKMDELREEDEWAGMLADLWPDNPPTPSGMERYKGEMDTLSRNLRKWWESSAQGGRGLVARMPPSVRFCALSSLGHEPVWQCPQCHSTTPDRFRVCLHCKAERSAAALLSLGAKPRPFRVRDPLFWIFRSAGVM